MHAIVFPYKPLCRHLLLILRRRHPTSDCCTIAANILHWCDPRSSRARMEKETPCEFSNTFTGRCCVCGNWQNHLLRLFPMNRPGLNDFLPNPYNPPRHWTIRGPMTWSLLFNWITLYSGQWLANCALLVRGNTSWYNYSLSPTIMHGLKRGKHKSWGQSPDFPSGIRFLLLLFLPIDHSMHVLCSNYRNHEPYH